MPHSLKMPSMVAGAVLSAALLVTAVPTAQATIIFTPGPGNNPPPGAITISFNNGDTGVTITGDAAGKSVQFSSLTSETLTVQGQHLQNDAGGNLTSTNVSAPGFLFDGFSFDLHNLNGNATVTVTDNLGNTPSTTLAGGSGNTSLTVTTAAGELIRNIAIDAPGGFGFFGQAAISGIVPVPVTEPASSLVLLGSALLGFGLIRHRKRG